MTVPARLAWSLIALAVVGWAGSWVLPPLPWLSHGWLSVLRHGLAGVFIGGICDWYAIRKVYAKVEQNHQALAEAVSETVVGDMIQPEQLIAELQERLADPEFRRELAEQAASHIPDRARLQHFLDEVWRESLRGHVVGWLIRVDPRASLRSARAPNVLDTPEIRGALHRALAGSVGRRALGEGLYEALIERYGHVVVWEPPLPGIKAVTVEKVMRRFWTPDDLARVLERTVDRSLGPLEGERAPPSGALEQALRAYGDAYVETWHSWPESERRVAAEALVDRLAPELMDALVEVVWSQRDELEALASQDFRVDTHPVVVFLEQRVGEVAREQLDQLDLRSKALLTDKLTRLGPAELRALLERQTRAQLDWIQVNGASLGAVLGLVVGALGLWLEGRGP